MNSPIPALTEETVQARIAELEGIESFPPSAEFVSKANPIDPNIRQVAASDPSGYWDAQAQLLNWRNPYSSTLDASSAPFYRWFTDGTLNVSENCLDRHVEAGIGERIAYHWHGEDGSERDVTYNELLDKTERLSNVLISLGVKPGDVVGIYLPMIPEAAISMLACTRIGAVHNVVFGGFSAESVAERMEVSGAKVLITANASRRKGKIIPMKDAVNDAVSKLPNLTNVIVVDHVADSPAQMMAGRDVSYAAAIAEAEPHCEPVELDAEAQMFILYSSGSTAKPKGILHTTGGYLTGATSNMRQVFDLKVAPNDDPKAERSPHDIFWCTADVGWITGHSYVVYGPLSNASTSVMYEGAPDYPHQGIWWEICQRRKVTIFHTAPTAIRACMRWGVEQIAKYDLSSLRLLGSVGEPINPKAWLWYYIAVGDERCPIVDTWWQTETGSMMITTIPAIDAAKPGKAGKPLPGISVALLDDQGTPVETDEEGLLAVTHPWPMMLRNLYGDPERYRETYWSKWGNETYLVGDAARIDKDGYVRIIGRVDDVINVSGHRLSTAEVESAIVAHPDVAEAAVVARPDELTGEAIIAFVTLRGGIEGSDAEAAAVSEQVAAKIGKLARPSRIIWAPELPKTRSGKIMRRLLRDLSMGRELGDTSTLADPSVVEQIKNQFNG